MRKDRTEREENGAKREELSARFGRWLAGEDLLVRLEERENREESGFSGQIIEDFLHTRSVMRVQRAQMKSFSVFYAVCAALCCVLLTGVLLLTVAKLPENGRLSENAAPLEEEYLRDGIEETGAVNIVSAVILSYRAFDTLGESFVLFTALCCTMILLRRDKRTGREELLYHDLSHDNVLRRAVTFVGPMSILYGFYVMFNGHLSPGGGFSGGAIAGAGLILLSAAFGFEKLDRILTYRVFSGVCGCALGVYLLSKTYTFVLEAAGLETHIPKGVPGTIFSGGLILPLNLAVGVTVSMTIFGIYCLFRRGRIGRDGANNKKGGGESDDRTA